MRRQGLKCPCVKWSKHESSHAGKEDELMKLSVQVGDKLRRLPGSGNGGSLSYWLHFRLALQSWGLRPHSELECVSSSLNTVVFQTHAADNARVHLFIH